MNQKKIKKTDDTIAPPFLKKKEAYVLSGLIGTLALALEYFILFLADDISGVAGRALGIIPIAAFILIRLILKNSQRK